MSGSSLNSLGNTQCTKLTLQWANSPVKLKANLAETANTQNCMTSSHVASDSIQTDRISNDSSNGVCTN